MIDGQLTRSSVDLGSGLSIQPPSGWLTKGRVIQPLMLNPKSRLCWSPAASSLVSLNWSVSGDPLPADLMSSFITLLIRQAVHVPVGILEKLQPGLIRIPLDSISDARVVDYPNSGRHLRIVYRSTDSNLAGTALFTVTEKHAYGEFQILAYEGNEPEYSMFLPDAQRSFESFSVRNSALSSSFARSSPHSSAESQTASAERADDLENFWTSEPLIVDF